MSRKCRSKRINFLKLNDDFYDDLGIIRLLKLPNGDSLCSLYLRAYCAALRTGGIITRSPAMSLEKQLAFMIHANSDMVAMVRDMLQFCSEYGLIMDDGMLIDFVSYWGLP